MRTAQIRLFLYEERGLETVEYAVMTALLSAAVVVACGMFAAAASARLDSVSGLLNGVD